MIYNDLALFVSVAHELNFSKAAQRHGLPASVASRRIAELEAHLGFKLFERTTRKVRLTEEGRLLLDRCQNPIEVLQEIGGGSIDSGPQTIRVTAPPLAARTTLAAGLLRFAAAHPSVVLDLVAVNRNLDFIRDNIDLAFRVGPIQGGNLITKKLWDVPYCFCIGKDLAKIHGLTEVPITRTQLLEIPAVTYRQPWLLGGGEVLSPPSVRHTFDELELVLAAVEAGFGIALLPSGMLTAKTQVVAVTDAVPLTRTMNVVYPSRRLLPGRVRSLIAHMSEHGPGGSLSLGSRV